MPRNLLPGPQGSCGFPGSGVSKCAPEPTWQRHWQRLPDSTAVIPKVLTGNARCNLPRTYAEVLTARGTDPVEVIPSQGLGSP